MADMIAPQKMDSLNSLKAPVFSSSMHTYLSYRKKMQGRLAELNNNVSNVIKESCSGIDNICNRVRQCLYEMDNSHKTHLLDEVTEYDIEEEKSRSCEDVSQEIEETIEDISTIDIIEDEKLEAKQNPENVTSLTPFFTEINCNDQDSDNGESCQKRILNKTIYSLLSRNMELRDSDSRVSLDRFKGAVSTVCDNFEVMNKLVENINKEIAKFSETTISTTKKSGIQIKSKEVNKSMPGLKPIKRLSKSNSRQKSVQVGDCLSETEVDYMDLLHKESSSFIIPDVYRKRAFTDLYEKLVAQIDANDSLIFFQTLMKRHKKLHKNKDTFSQFKLNVPVMNYSFPTKFSSSSSNKVEIFKKTDLRKKYADSLWFSQRNMVRDRSRKASRKNVRSRKVNVKTIENKSVGNEHYERTGSAKKKTAISESKFNSMGDATKRVCSLECTCKMVVQNDMAPSASTKCQLQWLRAKPAHIPQRKLKFLDILDDLTYRDLLPIHSEYPRKDNQQARELDYKDIQDTYIYKLMYGSYGSKTVWKQLLQPTQCSKNFIKLNKPVHSPSMKKVKEEKLNESFLEKFCTQNYSKSDILRKLSPYMFDPENTYENYSQSVIVMPVRVYYDNIRTNEPPMKLSNSSQPFNAPKRVSKSPSRDTKWHKMLELSTPKISRPMRVMYDGLPKKLEIPPITTSIKPSAMPSKPLLSSGRLNKANNVTKKVSSKSFPPKSFSLYCQNVKSARRDPTDLKQHENGALYSKIQADIEKIKKDIYGKKVNPADRKLWANKYGKSMGQKLISFVDNQKVETAKPLPLYAVPKLNLAEIPKVTKNVDFAEKINRHKEVLSHVKNLKTKNRAIQNNLKKAIDVIESRMVDILGNDSKSSQAFDVMEKEITNVLSLMKCKGKTDLKTISSKNCDVKDEAVAVSDKDLSNSLEDNYNIISEHLFERLERILDTGGSSMSNTSLHKTDEINPHLRKTKEEVKKKQKLFSSRRTKIDITSPSSSASLDEKIINRRSSKGYSKKLEKSEVKPKLSATTTALITEPISEQFENVCGDQNSVKSAPNDESQTDSKITDEDKSQDQIWNNSSGDFVKQEEVLLKSDSNTEINHTILDKVVSEDEVEKLPSEPKLEILPKISSPQLNAESSATINSDVEEFITEELNKVIESIVSLTEEVSIDRPPNEPIVVRQEKENIESSNYNTPRSVLSENKMKAVIKDGTNGYSEEVQKIINRMEHIYCQLDDIQESESKDRIPVFKEVDISNVQSEIFLTPFMQAVKENRRSPRPASKMALVEKTPSYYNVMSFLDALTNIQKEAPYEVYTAQLRNYSYVCYQTTVIYQAEIYYEAQHSSSTNISLPLGCLRKDIDESKQTPNKKVSFFQMTKEDKTNQVALCPFHRVKVVRISSQQFPPLEPSDEEIGRKTCKSNKTDHVPISENKINETENVPQKLCPLHNSDLKKHRHSMCDRPKLPCKINKEVGRSCDLLDPGLEKETIKHEECREKTKKCELSVLDDKSTQVFCQMQADQKQEESLTVYITANEDACLTSNEDQSADCAEYIEENPDDSKSTDKDFLEDSLLDPFYNYTNESITAKGVMQTIESIYEEGNAKHVKDSVPAQPKIVVFREVLENALPPPKDIKNGKDIEQYKKRLEKRKEMRLMRQSSSESVRKTVSTTHSDNENVILLKSFYAIVYILVFTALSLDYRCI